METILLVLMLLVLASVVVSAVVLLGRIRAGQEKTALEPLEQRLQARFAEQDKRIGDLAVSQVKEMGNLRDQVTQRVSGGLADVRQQLVQNAEKLALKVQESLAQGRTEQAGSLKQMAEGLDKRFDHLRQTTEKKLTEIRTEVEKKLAETVSTQMKSFGVVTERLQKLHEAAGQMVELSQSVGSLNTLLKAPKIRGAFGEWTLEQMLGELFGDIGGLFSLQHELRTGERVDAALFVKPDKSQFLCVDAKFPASNAQELLEGTVPEAEQKAKQRDFARDVKMRAREIQTKYIQPPETLDFAFMFVPSEAVYYLLLKNEALHHELLRMRVVPTSPNSFFAFLHALAYAMQGIKLAQRSEEIQKVIQQLGRDFGRFEDDYRVLGRHLRNATTKYDEGGEDVRRFSSRLTGLKMIELPESDSPKELPHD